jgi:Domain of unknown function (DUF4386)
MSDREGAGQFEETGRSGSKWVKHQTVGRGSAGPTGKGTQLVTQKIARVTGVLFVLTFITSIAAVLLYRPLLNDSHYILGSGQDTRIFLGALLEFLLVIANIGTAVVLYPIVKRQNQGVALGYVTARVVESVFILVGFLAILAVVTLRRSTGVDPASLVGAGKSLVAIHKWSFLFGPGIMPGIGNGMLLGYLMYRSGLVPRRMAMVGLIGGPLLVASGVAVVFGAYTQGSAWSGLFTVLEIVWEASLGIYLIVKGFRPSPIISSENRQDRVEMSLNEERTSRRGHQTEREARWNVREAIRDHIAP